MLKESSTSNATTMDRSQLHCNIVYALPKISLGLLIYGPMSVLPGLSAKYFGLSLAAIALAQFLSRIFDGITDPAIGYYSDRMQRRFGTYKPMIIMGAVLVLLSSTMLYIPYGWEAHDSEPVSFAYFLFFYLLFTLAWTIMDIPMLAWGATLSSDTKGRSQRFSFRTIALFISKMIFFSIPLLPFFGTTEITPETLKYTVYLSWLLMPLFLWMCLRWVPNSPGDPATQDVEDAQNLTKKQRFQKATQVIVGNRPLLFCYAAYALIGLGYAMSNGLTFFFVDNYLGLGEKLPYVFLLSFGVGVPAAWLWGVLAQKIGGQTTWVVGMSICLLGFIGTVFISPGAASLWPYLICKTLIGAGYSANFVAAYVVLANISDYGKWKFGQECTGTYFALCKTLFKFNAAVGIAIGLVLAGWLGFDPLAVEMSEAARVALRIAYIGLPVILFILAIIVIVRIPLSTHQHSVIHKRLAMRALRASD